MTIVDLKRLTLKNKPVIYTKILVELYNEKNHRQVHEMHAIIKPEKMHILTMKNLYNLVAY